MPNYNTNYKDEPLFGGCGKWIFIVIAFVIAFWGCATLAQKAFNKKTPAIKAHLKYHQGSIVVKTLAEIPEGPFLHRFIDFDLKKLCYLNAAGGGVHCLPLEEAIAGLPPEAVEDILTPLPKSQYSYVRATKWKPDVYEYYPKDYEMSLDENERKRARRQAAKERRKHAPGYWDTHTEPGNYQGGGSSTE